MRKLALLIGGLVLVMLPATLSSPAYSVRVRVESGNLVFCFPAHRDSQMQLQFTHSMYGGYVRESWSITPTAKLSHERMVTENAAAAEYYATHGTSFLADDGYVVPTDALTLRELVVRVNARGNHTLTVGDESVNMAELLATSTQVRISVERESCPEHTMSRSVERTHPHARSVGYPY